MINELMLFFDNALKVLQGFWSWCAETSWTIGNLTITPLGVFSTGLFAFLGVIVVLKIKNLVI